MSGPSPAELDGQLPFEVREVPRVRNLGPEEFAVLQRAAVPVVIEDEVTSWPAFTAWDDHTRIVDLVGADTEVYCRQVADPAQPYVEDYEPIRFGDLAREVFVDGGSRNYLTQGLVFPPDGFMRRMGRVTYPALLEELAVDCRLPRFVPQRDLMEGVLWMGSGGQVTPLHFDETDNLNAAIVGRKRWLLFPPNEIRNVCIDGNTARGSVASSFEALTAGGTWRGGAVDHAYACETGPGDLLFVPTAYLHQVWSAHEPSVAVNFWFANSASSMVAILRARTIRRGGIDHRFKRAAYGALIAAGFGVYRLRYAVRPGSMPAPDFVVGPTGYTTAKGL